MTEPAVRTDAVQQKNPELEEASRLKSEFLANMSHELRTPLNAIMGFSEVLRDGIMGDMTEQQRVVAIKIFTSGQHLLSLINDILDLSKVEAGKMTLDLEPVQISSLLANSLSIVREKAASRRIALVVDVADQLGSIQADARKVKQIAYNLLSNAVKFTHEGGQVTLRAGARPTQRRRPALRFWTGGVFHWRSNALRRISQDQRHRQRHRHLAGVDSRACSRPSVKSTAASPENSRARD